MRYTIMKRHYPVTKKARAEASGENAVASTQTDGIYGTRDVNPPIMPIPSKIANQLNDYATYTLKYCEIYNAIGIANGGKATKQFRINSLYDPNYTDVGHQPLGRDLLAAMYNHYRVLKTDFVVEFCPSIRHTTDPLDDYPWIIGDLVGTGQSVYPTEVETLGEMKRGRCWLVDVGKKSTWTRTIYPGLLDETIETNGVTDTAQQSMWTPMGNNPAEEQYYTIMVNNTSSAAAYVYFTLLVHITFTVQFRSANVDAFRD